VRFLFGGGGSTDPKVVTLHVWDDAALTDVPGAELYSAEVALTPDDQALQVVDLSGEALEVTGPYRVGVEFQHAATPSVAIDEDGRTPSRNFVDVGGGGWSESSAAGDYVLRTTLVPEPGIGLMFAAGVACLWAAQRRRTRAGSRARASGYRPSS
jgi:hypothetical protein